MQVRLPQEHKAALKAAFKTPEDITLTVFDAVQSYVFLVLKDELFPVRSWLVNLLRLRMWH